MDMGPITVPGTEAASQQTAAVPGQTSTVPPTPVGGQVSPGQVPPPPPVSTETSTGKTIIVILTLLFVYPLGVILMYVLTKWKSWIKILLTLPLILFTIGIVAAVVLVAVDPEGQIKKAECVSQCQQASDVQECVVQCLVVSSDQNTDDSADNFNELEPSTQESFGSGNRGEIDKERIKSSNDAAQSADGNLINNSIRLFYYDNKRYPATLDELVPKYLETVPLSPKGVPYEYNVKQDGSNYTFCVDYESEKYKEYPECFNAETQ